MTRVREGFAYFGTHALYVTTPLQKGISSASTSGSLHSPVSLPPNMQERAEGRRIERAKDSITTHHPVEGADEGKNYMIHVGLVWPCMVCSYSFSIAGGEEGRRDCEKGRDEGVQNFTNGSFIHLVIRPM
jgi:hypothetical protein